MRLRPLLPAVGLVALCLAHAAHAQLPDTTLWVTNGGIAAAVRVDNTLYLGGSFTRVAPGTGCAVPFDEGTAQPRLPFARVPGHVNAVLADGAGGWFVGGQFSGVDGTPRRNLVHLLADGSIAPWAPDPDSEVFALARSGDTLYVGGRFEHLGGSPRYKIGAVDVTFGLATAFDPQPAVPGPNAWPSIRSLAVAPGVVYAGGYFLSIGGLARAWVAALDPTTGAATSWNASANGQVLAIAPAGGTVYVGGYFSSIGGQPRASIAELNAADASATAFDPGANQAVRCFALDGTTLYVGGDFTTLGGAPRNRIASFDRLLGSLTGFDPSPSAVGFPPASVSSIAVVDGHVFAGGHFTSIGGGSLTGVAMLNAADGTALDWNANLNGDANALAGGGGTVFVGGNYASVGGVARSNLAALDMATGRPTAWAPVANDRVTDMVSDGTSLFIGGYFTQMNGVAHPYLARFDLSSGNLDAWNPGAGSVVSCLALSGPRLYVGGYPTLFTYGGAPTLAALDKATGSLLTWVPAAIGGPVNRIAADPNLSGDVAVASQGGFWRFRGSDAATLWSATFDGGAYTVAQLGGAVYAGGAFAHANLVPRANAAAFDAGSGALLPWDPSPNGRMSGLEQDGTQLFLTGWFDHVGAVARRGLAVVDPVSGVPSSYDAQLDGIGYRAMLLVNAQVLKGASTNAATAGLGVTGIFSSAAGFAAPSFAVLPPAPPLGVYGPPPPATTLRLDAAPMPARESTELRWSLPRDARVWLEVLDAQGRRVASPLAGEWRAAGAGVLPLRTRGWAPGVYLVRLRASDGARALRRIVVVE